MQIFADGSKRAANFFEELLGLFADRSAARGNHFRQQQAGENAVFFGDVTANGEAGALFAAESDFIFANELTDIFKTDGSLMDSLAVELCGGVNEFGGGDAASGGHFPSAGFDEIVINEW